MLPLHHTDHVGIAARFELATSSLEGNLIASTRQAGQAVARGTLIWRSTIELRNPLNPDGQGSESKVFQFNEVTCDSLSRLEADFNERVGFAADTKNPSMLPALCQVGNGIIPVRVTHVRPAPHDVAPVGRRLKYMTSDRLSV